MRRGLTIAAAVFVLDQASKYWILNLYNLPEKVSVAILPFFSLTMVWNQGVSMGLFQANGGLARWLLVAATSAIAVMVVFWLRRAQSFWSVYGLGLVLGGALGNILDRIVYGAVVDFVHLHAWGYSFYVFNLADAAITLGVMALIAEAVLPPKPAANGAAEGTGRDAGRASEKGQEETR